MIDFPISGNDFRISEIDFPISGNVLDFPISGNHFPISVILLISWYREIISWYREIISRYRKMRFISRYRELFPDIGKLNSRYQKIIPYFPISEIRIHDIGKSFPDIGNSNSRYQEIISDIGKWWIKTQMAFHTEESKHCYNICGSTYSVASKFCGPTQREQAVAWLQLFSNSILTAKPMVTLIFHYGFWWFALPPLGERSETHVLYPELH